MCRSAALSEAYEANEAKSNVLGGAALASFHNEVFNGWTSQHAAQTTSIPLTLFESLKAYYEFSQVVQTSFDRCDLIGYADAGFAKRSDKDDGNEDDEDYADDKDANWTIRAYHASGSRLDDKPKMVIEQVKFRRWFYTWKNMKYIVYRANYEDPKGFGTLKLQFILSDKEDDPSARGIDALILAASAWTLELHEEIYVFDSQLWVKDKNLYESVQGSSWDEVILNKTLKANLIADVESFFDNQALYKKLAVPWKRGIILHGVPGKNYQDLHYIMNVHSFGINVDLHLSDSKMKWQNNLHQSPHVNSLLSSFPYPIPLRQILRRECHGPKWAISTIFQKARKMAPCLLIFEDLDSLVTEKTRSYFLNEVDGLESNDGILMIGSTNHLGKLDSSISKRPSRFDRKYCFRVPNEEERRAYVEFWRGKSGGDEGDMVDFGEDVCSLIAKMTEGFSFAYLKEMFIVTLLSIARSATGAGDDGVEEEKESFTTASTSISTSTPTDDGVVFERDDSMESVFRNFQPTTCDTEQTAEQTAEQTKPRKTLPKVDIPEHLINNVFLNALVAQAKMLVEEMDSTDELMGVEKVPGLSGMGGAMHIGMARARAGMGGC
ncbi:uncharacterized protein EAF01_004582 [Botrytis porri]|uniref:uncharacterized protein n=1 Tax=Botrytis porri TaxID=87229 RepID=UPI001901635A|nr:uncharacterized protein EAF01_004582 [Botrytis porri]KAF7906995.1 hypothetical protein EAF01_004582 [Botrytis porri]